MPDTKPLYEAIKSKAYDLGITKQIIPAYITDNLKHSFFDWQQAALENFLTYQAIKEKEHSSAPTHLMFNMATGTGKTLLMAATILYYYQQGYRHFLFFVNRNNIVDKTENNFIDNMHTKYLFTEKMIIDDRTIPIKKVNIFSDHPQGIEIKFTSIQKLYNDIHLERENQTTLDDLHSKDIVMLADEAHHLNADTKEKQPNLNLHTEITNKTSKVEVERKGWEHTVIELILKRNAKKEHHKNVLLEFTATIPEIKSVAKKYQDKIIYKFGLKEFLQAGYTKEINLISSTLEKKERILQALLFQWYRHTIALKNGIANFKPVILFRSKTIAESETDHKEFLDWIANITGKDFDFLKTISKKIHASKEPTLFEMGESRTESLLKLIKEEKISLAKIAKWIKDNFYKKNVIITNSKTNKTQTEKTDVATEHLLNSLEDKNNHIRAIFTVDRLTEGWDVLNLFDIVRLYQGQNAGGSTKKTPQATIKEKQLIGRGVRYFPFTYKEKIHNKRKFDDDLNHQMRVLEELYYYTYDEESRYISHLKNELRKDGYIRDDKILQTFSLKKKFKNSEFYKNSMIYYNNQSDNPNRQRKNLNDIKKDFYFQYKVTELTGKEELFRFDEKEKTERLNLQPDTTNTIFKKIKEVEKHIFYKALHVMAKQENSFYQFENLKKELTVKSIEDLQNDSFLGDFEIKLISSQNTSYDDLNNNDKLKCIMKFLAKFHIEFQTTINPKIGSAFVYEKMQNFLTVTKTKTINKNDQNNNIAEDHEWYVLDGFVGTNEEKELIKFINHTMGNLKQKYKEIYLLRNEEVYKIYDFEKGRGFQPDFLLFLKKSGKDGLRYQIFIEPKGDMLIEHDQWKQKFLQEITEKYGFEKIICKENPHYRLIGFPFFNQEKTSDFDNTYKNLYK